MNTHLAADGVHVYDVRNDPRLKLAIPPHAYRDPTPLVYAHRYGGVPISVIEYWICSNIQCWPSFDNYDEFMGTGVDLVHALRAYGHADDFAFWGPP